MISRILTSLIALFIGASACAQAFAEGAKLKLAVIPKGTTHVFWKSVEAGAKSAGKDLGVEIIWKGPLKENDRAQQIQIVEQFVTEGVSGIVLAPLDDTALVRPVASAMQKKIPVVIFDSALKGGSASTTEREAGFLEVIRKNEGVQVLVENRYGGATMGEAKTAAMNMLDHLKEAQGIFCPNESSTFGMLLALRQNNLAGKVRFVGFDTSPPLVEALQKGEIDALVAQNPTRMGYLGVKTCVEHIRGQKIETNVDTGVCLITRENLNEPEIKKLLGM
jgi:ribose transport system substrate-binding protein